MLPAFLAVALHQAVITVPLAVLRAEERLAEYVRANFVYAIAYAVLVLGAVVVLGLGVIGAITAGLVASVVLLFVTSRTVEHRLTAKVIARWLSSLSRSEFRCCRTPCRTGR